MLWQGTPCSTWGLQCSCGQWQGHLEVHDWKEWPPWSESKCCSFIGLLSSSLLVHNEQYVWAWDLRTDLKKPNIPRWSVGNIWPSPLSGRSSSPTTEKTSPRFRGRRRTLNQSGPCSIPPLQMWQFWAVDSRSLVPVIVANSKPSSWRSFRPCWPVRCS